MRYDQVADLIKIIDSSACDELVLETAELKLVVRRSGADRAPSAPAFGSPLGRPIEAAGSSTSFPPAATPKAAADKAFGQPTKLGGFEVRAPMVGIFYRASSPDAPPFVEVGAAVKAGQPLCVIEVMKLFTTICAEQDGRVADIGARNGELVEFDSVLFVFEDI